jgi:hypothetical protein
MTGKHPTMSTYEIWKMTEAELLEKILARCAGRDAWPARLQPERHNQRVAANKGFPDLHIVGPGGSLYRELKSMKGNGVGGGLNHDQMVWKYRIKCGGLDWDIWTPADLASGRIDSELDDVATPDEHTVKSALAMTRP